MNDLLTVHEVLALMRISRPTLRSWRKSGVLPFVKIGKIIRFKRNDVQLLLQAERGENAKL